MILINDFLEMDSELRLQNIYNLCLQSDKEKDLKRLLMLKTKHLFDSELITVALTASIAKGHDNYFTMLWDCADKNHIKLDFYHMRSLFNMAIRKERYDLAHIIDEKFNIVKKDLSQQCPLELTEDGKRYYCFGTGGPESNAPRFTPWAFFNDNCFGYHLKLQNASIVNKFIIAQKINPTLVEYELIEHVANKNVEAIKILINNNITKDIIDKSKDLALFLSEPTEFVEMKNAVKEMMNIIELKKQLEQILPGSESVIRRHKV